MSNRKFKTAILLILALIFFYLSSLSLFQIQKTRKEIQQEVEEFKKLPPEIVFTTVLLGGFRGILVDFLWMRARKLQEEGKYFELVQLSDWICKLQPNIPEVWVFNAWNLSYNVSVEFPTPEERWNWIYQGIKLLRDKGLKYAPDSPEIYKELAWIYFNKISSYIDSYSYFYKEKWARIMKNVLDDIKLDEIIANSSYEKLITDTEVKQILEAFQSKGIDLLKNWKQLKENNFSGISADLEKYLEKESFRKIKAYMCGKILREEYKLIPEDMKEIEEKYLPLDWKVASSHSLYWIEEGMKKTKKMDKMDYERLVYFSLNLLLEWGRIDFRKVGNEEIMIESPYLKVAEILNDYYKNLIEVTQHDSGVMSSYRGFLRNVIMLSYTMNDLKTTAKYFNYLKENFPDEVKNLTLTGYLLKQFSKIIKEGTTQEVFSLLYGTLYQAFWYLGVGETERYLGLDSLAKIIYRKVVSEYTKFQSEFPTYEILKRKVYESVVSTFPPDIAKELKKRVKIK